MNIPVMRKFDRFAGVAIIKALSTKKRELPKNPRRILIIKLFGFGNFIFLSPVFKALRKLYPKASIEVLTFTQNKEICEMYGLKVHPIRFKVRYLTQDLFKFAARNRGKFDIAFDYEQFVRLSAIVGKLAAPKYFIGLCTPNSKKHSAYDLAIEYAEDRHVVEEFYSPVMQLARMAGKEIESPALVPPNSRSSEKVKEILQSVGNRKIVGVCAGGRNDDMERRYPKAHMAKALDMILAKDVRVIFFGAKNEKADIDEILSMMKKKKKCIDALGLPLPESAELISKCDVFISNDTGPIHLAASLGVFCIGLYGPSKEWVYGPYTDRKIILRDKHRPVRSNHNEKDSGWPSKWWPEPEKVYKATLTQL